MRSRCFARATSTRTSRRISMEESIRRQVREMGIDPLAAGRITLDTGEREGSASRAFCSPVRVPDEVYLVLRPHGGQTDWTTFLHELGHALHFAYMRPDLAFEYRWLGDNSITEGYAMLFDHRMQDRRLVEAIHGARARTARRRSCARPDSRSCTSSAAIARS